MKELKFRAWDGDRYWYNIVPSPIRSRTIDICKEITSHEPEYWNMVDVIEGVKAVEQYTGLKDKNGKEIYEGDIVTLDGEWEVIKDTDCSVITFENGCFRVGDGYENEAGSYLSDWRVIGNVHENANLLEKK